MNNLKAAVHILALEEYGRASARFGSKHNSPHEAYAVIKEEQEEAQADIATVDQHLSWYWDSVKCNDNPQGMKHLAAIRHNAINAAAELIQVAAMAHKALQGYGRDTP